MKRETAAKPRQTLSKASNVPAGIRFGSLGLLGGFAVRRMHQCLSAGLGDVVAREGMKPHQFTALSLIVDNPQISQSELAKALQIKPSNIVPLIDEMERRGSVRRTPGSNGRRSYALVATAEGRALRDRTCTLIAEYEGALLARLTGAERAALFQISEKLCPKL
jgi:DNA-binding MarR family transcriptional regulator